MPEQRVFRMKRLNRRRTTGGGGGGDLLPALTWPDDFTYLGAYVVPAPAAGDDDYAFGLALRYEASDATNPVHLISAAFHSGAGNAGFMGHAWEWRDATPTIPASPTNPASYGTATKMKDYGSLYGTPGGTFKRKYYIDTDLIAWTEVYGTCPVGGLFYDLTDERLYWTYADTYSGAAGNEENNYHFGYSELNYGAGTATPHGPWRLDTAKYKAGMQGLVDVPAAFCSASGLASTKRLATGFGGSACVISAGDSSIGPAITAFVPPSGGATEETALASTPLIGYWPYNGAPGAGRDRATRPAGSEYIHSGTNPFDSGAWDVDKWTWTDGRFAGGVWIHGTSKAGLVTVHTLGGGLFSYWNAQVAAEKVIDLVSVFSEADLAEVVAGTSARYEIQPTSTVLQFDAVDYTAVPYVSNVLATIATITSDSGQLQSTYNATVTTNAAHGLSTGGAVSIRGTSSDSSYGGNWQVDVVDSTSFKIRNLSNGQFNWSGTAATGGSVRTIVGNPGDTGAGIGIKGLAYDPNTQKLYLLFRHTTSATLMVAVWSVDC